MSQCLKSYGAPGKTRYPAAQPRLPLAHRVPGSQLQPAGMIAALLLCRTVLSLAPPRHGLVPIPSPTTQTAISTPAVHRAPRRRGRGSATASAAGQPARSARRGIGRALIPVRARPRRVPPPLLGSLRSAPSLATALHLHPAHI